MRNLAACPGKPLHGRRTGVPKNRAATFGVVGTDSQSAQWWGAYTAEAQMGDVLLWLLIALLVYLVFFAGG